MQLTRMRFGGVPPFTEPVELRFDKRVNLFVGANATGKSRLLSEIDEYFNDQDVKRHLLLGPGQEHLRLVFAEERERADDWLDGKNILLADTEFSNAHHGINANPRPPVICIGPTRIGLPGIAELGELDSYGSTVEEVLSGPFCGARLKAAIDLLYAKTRGMSEQEKREEPAYRSTQGLEFSVRTDECGPFVRQVYLRGTAHLSQGSKLSNRLRHRISR